MRTAAGITTLAEDYAAGSLRLTVTDAANFPTSGPFTVAITDPVTQEIKLFFRANGRSGTTLFGAAEGTDAPASAGDLAEVPVIQRMQKRFIFERRW
jgi:hypothetical protein